VTWEVEGTDEFAEWYGGLSAAEQAQVDHAVGVLEQVGPTLGRPTVDRVYDSAHPNMKELRAGETLRVLFAFDPRRIAILLIGGDKANDKSFYERFIAEADALYTSHLASLKPEEEKE
jgi:hypothetical protein